MASIASKKSDDILDSGVLLKQGTGELEMLTFSLGSEIFGVNVSKVREIIRADYHIASIPKSDESILGIFQPRDEVITSIDLNHCLYGVSNDSKQLLYKRDWNDEELQILKNKFFVICGFNNTIQAWLVDSVRDIIRLPWADIIPPAFSATDKDSAVTGIYQGDNELIQIIDFEALMVKINPESGLTMSDVEAIPEAAIEKVKSENINVFIADDSKMLNKLISDAVAKAGYNVTSFGDGQQLYDRLKALKASNDLSKCDIVITDVEMPAMDGMQLCKLIKNDEAFAKIPVLIFSSLVDDAMKKKCETVKADRAFSKPEIGNVIDYIHEAIDKYRD